MSRPLAIKKRAGLIGAYAECDDCGKKWDGYKNAQAVGAKHAASYGHRVHGEAVVAFWYEP